VRANTHLPVLMIAEKLSQELRSAKPSSAR
jgi:hypothetical protein